MKNLYLMLFLLVAAASGAQTVNIPDENFKARLIFNGYDTNADNEIQLSEAQAVTGTVNLNYSTFADMTGIEAFTNAQYLYCEQNSNITSISLANLPNLKAVHFGENANLTTLTLTNLTGLDTLKCNNGKLMTLDLSTSPGLKSVNANNNFLTALNVSTASGLKQLFYGGNQMQFAAVQLPAPNVIEALDCGSNGLAAFDDTVFPMLHTLQIGGNAMPSLTINNLPLLEYLYATNNQMTNLTVAPGTPLKELIVQGNSLTGLDLSQFPTLEKFQADGNHLTSLTFGNLPNLTYASLALNDLTSVAVSGLTNIEYLNIAGNELTSLDVSNLTHLESLYCGSSQISDFTLTNTPALEILDFTSANISSIDLSGNPGLTQLYCGSNPIGMLDLSQVPNLWALMCWQDGLTSLDISMLSNLTVLMCNDNQLTTLDCNNNPLLTQIDIYANPLETLFIKNGSQQYFNDAGNFVENPNLSYICADESEISYLQSKPGMNASVNTYCTFTPVNNYNTVTGTVRFDAGSDGCAVTDFAMPFVRIDTSDSSGAGASFTNADGSYVFYTQDMSCGLLPNFENPAYFDLFLPAVIDFPAQNATITQDFCVVANGVHQDLEIVVAPVVPARPGFEAVYKIVIRNKGNQVMSMPLGFALHYNDDLMDFMQASAAPDSQGAGLLQWDYANLQPFESRSIDVVMQINAPTNPDFPVNVDDQLVFTGVIEAIGGDEMPDDNAFQFHQTVVGAFDPNDMICLEGDSQPVEQIGKYLHYIANFENTGTDAAANIVVKTVFDPAEFDVSSLRILDSSDDVDVRVRGNQAEYIFEGINLEIGGHGNILLKIKSQDNLANGDMVANRADIFFDYNLPITTNDAETTFQTLSASAPDHDQSIAIYPNPTAGLVNISAAANIRSVQIYDIQGRLLQTAVRDASAVSIDISARQSGIYFVKVISDNGSAVQKIVKN